MKKKNILITGGTGFIGSNIYKLLTKSGYEVDCIVRRKNKNFKRIIVHDSKKPFQKKNIKNMTVLCMLQHIHQ